MLEYKLLEINRDRLDPFLEDRLIPFCLENNLRLCGGFARYLVSPRPGYRSDKPKERLVVLPEDIDIFLPDDNWYFISDFLREEKFMQIKSSSHKRPIFRAGWYKYKLQFIFPSIDRIISDRVESSYSIRYAPVKMEEVLNSFDFSICKAGLHSKTHCLIYKTFEDDEKNGILRIEKWQDKGIHTMYRIAKYVRKGYKPMVMQMYRLFTQLEKEIPEKIKDIDNKEEFAHQVSKIASSIKRSPMSEILDHSYEELMKELRRF